MTSSPELSPAPAGAAPVVPAAVGQDVLQRRTLRLAVSATLAVLAVFVTPLSTGVRTAETFSASAGAEAWMLSSMSVGLAASLLLAGALADNLGRARVFVAGLALLGVGSLVTLLSPGVAVFVASRLISGLGGAAVLAASLGLLGQAFPAPAERARATALWGASIGAGTGAGGLLTVVLDHGSGWRATYGATAVLAFGLAVVAARTLPRVPASVRHRLDLPGAVTLACSVVALLAGLIDARQGRWLTAVALLVASAVFLVGFVLVQLRRRRPLVDLTLFRSRGLVVATAGGLLTGVGVVGVISYFNTMAQRGIGLTLVAANMLILLWAAMSVGTSVLLRHLSRVDGGLLLGLSLLVSAGGLALLGTLASTAGILAPVPGLLLLGVGYGAVNASLGREAIAHVPPAQAGVASGLNNTARYVGAAIGVTLVVLQVSAAAPTGNPADVVIGWNHAAWGAAALCSAAGLVATAISASGSPRAHRR